MLVKPPVMQGAYSGGKGWRVDLSRASAVPEGKGQHYVLTFSGDDRPQDEIPMIERRELLGVAYEVACKLADAIAPGRFRIEMNGSTAASRPHFHIHIICPSADLPIRRIVDSIVAPAPAR